jgi:glycosyltransferase involved in cell wall biosynthesis
LDAVPAVTAEYPQVTFILVGALHNSISDRTLSAVLRKNRVSDHVRFPGHIPWKELAERYRRATIFVMPSYYETFGISVIEAMAFGLPVVATTAGGLPEVVEHGVTGILISPGDPQGLSEAIMELLGDPTLRVRMGQAGREKVIAEFTIDRIVEQNISLFGELLELNQC